MNAAALLQEAIALEANGNIAGAAERYEKVLKREPSNPEALLRLGRAYCMSGQLAPGAELLRKVAKLYPNHAPAQNMLGMALDRLGKPAEALACFDHAIKADPNFAAALANKADALAALGKHDEAVAQYDRALAIDAGNIAALCNRGNALQALGRYEQAVESFQRALALNRDLPEAQFNLANALQKLERYEEAIQLYLKVVLQRPNLVDVHINLGQAMLALRRMDEAILCYERAVKLQPNSAQTNYRLGFALWENDRFEDSLVYFDKALAIEPDHAAALNNKGRVLFVTGRIDEARPVLEKVAALDPRHAENFLHLAEVKRFKAGDPEIAAMEDLLRDAPSLSEDEQSSLHFAMAKAYEHIGKRDQSFHHLVQGNALVRKKIEYDEAERLGVFRRVPDIFTPELLREKSGHGDPSAQPIFIVGMPRSGTTLIEQILASHPRVHGAGEMHNFERELLRVTREKFTDYPDFLTAMAPEAMGKIGSAYLSSLPEAAAAADRFTDKLPGNFVYAGLICLALPNARIIHARRNPVDTCVSCFSIRFAERLEFTYDLAELGRYYRAYEAVMAHWRKLLPPEVLLEVRYEDLVDNIETHTRRMLAHCGLEWDAACLAFHETDRPVRTASAAQVRRPLYRSAVGRWRAYKDQLRPLLAALELPLE